MPFLAMPRSEGIQYQLVIPQFSLTARPIHSTTGGAGGPTVRVSTLAALKAAVAGNSPKTVILTCMSVEVFCLLDDKRLGSFPQWKRVY